MMKYLFSFFLTLCQVQTVYCQTTAEFVFYDKCGDTIVNLEYEVLSIQDPSIVKSSTNSKVTVDEPGNYIISTGINRGNLISLFEQTVLIDNSHRVDTIQIPSIAFSVSGGLHDRFWVYQNCSKTCEGRETSYFQNGNKNLEGIFNQGKPLELTTYRPDGTLAIMEFFKPGTIDRTRVNFYDANGDLKGYELYRHRKRKSVKRVFNDSGLLLSKSVERHPIER
jgi:hypothetical protein